MFRSHKTAGVIAIALGAFAVWPTAPALAVTNLRSAVVRTSEVPAGFSHPHTRLYAHYVTDMTVNILSAGAPSPSTCNTPPSFQRDGWQEGLVEGFDSARTTMGLRLCAYQFATPKGAHRAYRDVVSQSFSSLLAMKVGQRLTFPAMGNEAAGIRQDFGACSCTTQKSTTMYQIIFRHDNAVINVSYTGPITLPVSTFVRLVSGTDTRLK